MVEALEINADNPHFSYPMNKVLELEEMCVDFGRLMYLHFLRPNVNRDCDRGQGPWSLPS